MKILIHAPASADGTSFYRAFGPFNALSRQYPDIQITKLDTGVAWDVLLGYDLVFIQRPASPWEVSLIRMCKAYGIPVWCDWDDHYFEIPESNNRKKFYTNYHLDCVRVCAREADFISVSTEILFEEFKKFNDKIKIIPNAMDQRLFNSHDSDSYDRDCLILWRGSDTHSENLDFYKDEILKLMDETPDYVWGFFGFYPQWAVDHLPSERIRLYQHDGCIEYIHRLLALRPRLVYVCHTDNAFNRSRSNIAWQEATYAGAVCVVPDTQSWKDVPGYHYNSKESFVEAFKAALSSGSDVLMYARNYLKENFNLQQINKDLRFPEVFKLSAARRPELPPVKLPEPFTDEQFFNYNKEHGWTAENEDWVKGQDKFADMLKNDFNVNSVFDIGCGPGGLLESLIRKNVHCMGVDSNPFNKEFFDKRNPDFKHRFILGDAQDVIPDTEQRYDMVVSVEVFEHMPDWVAGNILANWRNNCKFFLFTSTQYHSTPHFDLQWGHINVKPTEHWIKFFESNGFKFIQMLEYPTKEAMLFIAV